MHAISHDSQVHQKGCIYAQLEPAEEPAAWAGVQQQQNGAQGSEEEDEEEDEEESTPEIRLVPQDESVCKWAYRGSCKLRQLLIRGGSCLPDSACFAINGGPTALQGQQSV